MKNTTFTLLIFILTLNLSASLVSDVDKYNTYRWNQKENSPWFEWWYYKVTMPETQDSFFFVYGVVNPWDKNNKLNSSRSYVSMGDFTARVQVEEKFLVQDFYASVDEVFVNISGNTATDKHITGNLKSKDGSTYSWDINVKKDWAFNAVGWAIGKGITNIEWYPAQASAKCSGQIISNQKLYHLVETPCYQDRNWGKTFPIWWTWVVSNQFKNNPDTVLAVGGGRPEYMDTRFPLEGVAIGLRHKGVVYEFRPNDFNRVKVDINFGKWEMEANDLNHKIEITASAPKEKFMDLQFVTPTGKIFHDFETLNGHVVVRLYKRSMFKWKLIDTIESDYAGIEYGAETVDKLHINTLFETKIKLQ